jgi:hypothetical protein
MAAFGYSPQTAATAFDPPLSANAIRTALNSGALKSHKVARHRVILAADLVAWIASCPEHRGNKKGPADAD